MRRFDPDVFERHGMGQFLRRLRERVGLAEPREGIGYSADEMYYSSEYCVV
jgi:hypothetical protein